MHRSEVHSSPVHEALLLYRGYMGYMGRMENKMETTIV